MKIRFFSAFETSMVTFYSDLVPYLAKAGHEVEVVISKSAIRSGRDLESELKSITGAKVKRTIDFGWRPNNIFNKAILMLAYFIHMSIYSLFGSRTDCNILLTTPPFLPLWGYVLLRIRRQPYYVVMMDVFPQLMIEYGIMGQTSPMTKLLDWLATLAWRTAEGVIVIGRCMAEHIEAKGVPARRIHIISNWMNEQIVYPIEHTNNCFRHQHGLSDKFVVLYSGNMGFPHYFDDILTAAEQLKDDKHIVFVFIGGGTRCHEIQEAIKNRQLTNVTLLPFQDVEMLPYSLSAGDLHLVTMRDSCTGLAVPSKSYGIFAAGRPILYQGREDGEIARIILEEQVGTVVRCGNVEAAYREHPQLRTAPRCWPMPRA